MINKIRRMTSMFFKEVLKDLRISYIREEHFVGKYIDIEIERRNWAKDDKVIITGEKTMKNEGGRKVHHQIVFFVPNTFYAKWLGFKKGIPHRRMAGWI